MNTSADAPTPPAAAPARSHPLAAAFVLAVMVVGCGVLWVGAPLGGMWLAGELTDSFAAHAPLALCFVLVGMVGTGLALAWLNELYLRITASAVEPVRGLPVRRHGPLEPLLVVCFFLALAALSFWFFVLAENPGRGVFGTG